MKSTFSSLLGLLLFPLILVAGTHPLTVTIETFKGHDQRGRYQLEYPQLHGDNVAKDTLAAINQRLKADLATDWRCEPDPRKQDAMFVHTKVQVTAVSPALLSVLVHYNGDCGGPHPDRGIRAFIYDIPKASLLSVPTESNAPKAFKTMIITHFVTHPPQKMIPDCQHLYTADELAEADFEYALLAHSQALSVRLSYAHVARACEYAITLDCPSFIRYIKETSPLQGFCRK
jgi:hypothetical protein